MDVGHPLAVVTPTLDGDVLTRLALAQAAFTPGQLQRLLPNASVEGIRKVLNRLSDHGIVTATRVGNAAITYALNREHLAAESIVALAQQPAVLRRRIEDVLGTWKYPPTYAAIFGSWARGDARTSSDIDLFFVRRPGAPDDEWDAQVATLEDAVSKWTGNDTRAYVIDERRLSAMAREPVLQSILRDGLTLRGSSAWLRQVIRRAEVQHGSVGAHNQG